VYADFDNQAPSFVDVCIDGTCHGMTVDTAAAAPLQDGDHRNGEQYSYTTMLPSGTHAYFFEASDGTDTTRLPASGTLGGPSVSDLAITTASLPDGTVGASYGAALTATGGTPPYNWAAATLPPGIGIDPAAGTLFGTPTAAGTYWVTIDVTDAAGASASKSVTLTVKAVATAPNQIADLIALVRSFHLRPVVAVKLEAPLWIARFLITHGGDPLYACPWLDLFIRVVHAETGRAITAVQAGQLIAAAEQVKAVLGCP
jgi:hypothetical protein